MKLSILWIKVTRVLDSVLRTTFGLVIFPGQFKSLSLMFCGYLTILVLSIWFTAGFPIIKESDNYQTDINHSLLDVLEKLSSAYTPIFIDISLVIAGATYFLYRYSTTFRLAAIRHRNNVFNRLSDKAKIQPVFARFPDSISLSLRTTGEYFIYDGALQCTIDATALGSERLFQSVQGGSDFAKITLQSVEQNERGVCLNLGTCSFRDLNLAHYWAFLPLAVESTDETNRAPKCMFDLLSKSQVTWAKSICNVLEGKLEKSMPAFAPNPLGVSIFLSITVQGKKYWLMRRRSEFVADDPGKYCAAVAGLIDVFPEFSGSHIFNINSLFDQEYRDEVYDILSEDIKPHFNNSNLKFIPLGLLFTPKANYQPEFYFLAEVTIIDYESVLGSSVKVHDLVAKKYMKEVCIIENIDSLGEKLRNRDSIALQTVFSGG